MRPREAVTLWAFFDGMPRNVVVANNFSDALELMNHPEKYGMPKKNYYMGPIAQRTLSIVS